MFARSATSPPARKRRRSDNPKTFPAPANANRATTDRSAKIRFQILPKIRIPRALPAAQTSAHAPLRPTAPAGRATRRPICQKTPSRNRVHPHPARSSALRPATHQNNPRRRWPAKARRSTTPRARRAQTDAASPPACNSRSAPRAHRGPACARWDRPRSRTPTLAIGSSRSTKYLAGGSS